MSNPHWEVLQKPPSAREQPPVRVSVPEGAGGVRLGGERTDRLTTATHHVRRKDQNSLVLATRPLGVIQEIWVIVHKVSQVAT